MNEYVNQDICPLCGKPNNCQHDTGKGCWCDKEHFPEELLSRIPTEKRMKACVCRDCLEKFRQDGKSGV